MTIETSERKDAQVTEPAVNAERARQEFGSLLDRVLTGERILITRHGKPFAALVSVKDLRALEEAAA